MGKLINCADCGREVSKNAKTCPGCGAAVYSKQNVWGIIIGALFFLFLFNLLISPDSPVVEAEMQSLHDRVAIDFEEQYNIAKSSGNRIEICVQAGIVKAAYLQAKDTDNYNRWDAIHDEDCRRAGIPNQ